jgi:hypothetical protein
MITASTSLRIYCSVFKDNKKKKQIENNQYKSLQLYENKKTIYQKLDQQIYKAFVHCFNKKTSCLSCEDLLNDVYDTLCTIKYD